MATDTFQVIPNKLADPPLNSDGLGAASKIPDFHSLLVRKLWVLPLSPNVQNCTESTEDPQHGTFLGSRKRGGGVFVNSERLFPERKGEPTKPPRFVKTTDFCEFSFLQEKTLRILGACAMTTKFLDNKICTIKISFSWLFPRKATFLDISPLCPHAPTPLKSANFIFMVVSQSLKHPSFAKQLAKRPLF